jgi:two-component system, cell cycle sensor histidine kinase and response regulator CckA
MRDSDERLLQAIRVGNIGIFDHDHEADTIYWSPELREMYGWDADEPATLPKIVAQVHPEDSERVVAAVRRAHDPAGDRAFDIEHRIIDRKGELRWMLTRSQTRFEELSGGRRPRRTIGAVQDVTERRAAEERLRRLEAQLIHAQKMESVGRLAGGVAHDFNNTLMVISNSLEVSLAALPPGHATRDALSVAMDAARSAASLTRQLLTFSRKEAIAPRTLDLNEVMRRTEKMVVRLLGRDIQLQTVCGEDLTLVRFDPGQVEQIILNLVVNARDAMPRGGRLKIETSNIDMAEGAEQRHVDARPGRYVLLAVSDTGIGMTDEVKAHLFEPFFTTKEPGKGTGLGLAMVYGAVRQNGGWIDFETEVGQGTTFELYLPAATAQAEAP